MRPDDYDRWRVRPVMVVHTFVHRLELAIRTHPCRCLSVGANGSLRHLGVTKIARHRMATTLRFLRRSGLTASTVRRLALILINAPESYGGVARRDAGVLLASELRTLFSNSHEVTP